MNVFWLLHGSDVENNQILSTEISSYGDSYRILNRFENLIKIQNDDYPVIGMVPLDACARINRLNFYPGVYCNLENFKCTTYYPFFQKWLLNNRYYMLPYSHILNMKCDIFYDWLDGKYADIFIRPNSGFKTFTGQLLREEFFKEDLESLCNVELYKNELCLISPPVNIKKEWRFVIGNRKIIACSQYRSSKKSPSGICVPIHSVEAGAPENVQNFVKNVLSEVDWQPDPIYTMDVCENVYGYLKIVEINSFSASGLYKYDIPNLVKEVRNIVIEDYTEWKKWEENNVY